MVRHPVTVHRPLAAVVRVQADRERNISIQNLKARLESTAVSPSPRESPHEDDSDASKMFDPSNQTERTPSLRKLSKASRVGGAGKHLLQRLGTLYLHLTAFLSAEGPVYQSQALFFVHLLAYFSPSVEGRLYLSCHVTCVMRFFCDAPNSPWACLSVCMNARAHTWSVRVFACSPHACSCSAAHI